MTKNGRPNRALKVLQVGNTEKLVKKFLTPLRPLERIVFGYLFGFRDGTCWKPCRTGKALGIGRREVVRIENSGFKHLLRSPRLFEQRLESSTNGNGNRNGHVTPFLKNRKVKFFPRVRKLRMRRSTKGKVKLTADRICELVCEGYGITSKIMFSYNKRGDIAFAIQVAMFLVRTELGWSSQAVADEFKRRDHGTVLGACKKMSLLFKENPEFRADIEKIRAAY